VFEIGILTRDGSGRLKSMHVGQRKKNGETAMTTTMKTALASLAACLALNSLAADISHVSVRQRWPWSKLVDIDYVIANATQGVDIAVTAHNGSIPLVLGDNELSGNLYGVSGQGARRIVWDPTQSQYTNEEVLSQFKVTLTPVTPPLYMIVDLTKEAGADKQIEYVYEEDLTNGLWGAWMRNPITNAVGEAIVESVIWTGVTTNDLYKTDKLVLRRVPAGSFQQGDTQNGADNVTLTKNMYAGVFEVTQKQWDHVMGTTGGTATQAKHTVSYYEIREDPANADDPAVNWPSNRIVNATSFMGRLRAKTGIGDFDLPTEAQWEYVCRAKTTTVFNDGNTKAKYTGTEDNNNGNTNEHLNALGWYKFSAPTPPTAAQLVGSKRPNAWGLYDMHGNVWEWCLNWGTTSAETGTDPDGADSGSKRVFRGGSVYDSASYCRSAFRYQDPPGSRFFSLGFRLFRTLP